MNIRGIEYDSIVDGPGIRLSLFFQGCPHHCKGCHNPETWDYDVECEQYTVEDIIKIVEEDEILAGITLSGGEPLSPCNFEEIIELCKKVKYKGKNIWVYTGYTVENLIRKYPKLLVSLFPYLDVIVDGPFVEEQKDLLIKFRGSKNQRLIDVKKFLNNEEYVME